MKRLLLILALLLTPISSARALCCTAAEVQTLGDLDYIARAALNHTGPLRDRLYTLAMQLKAGTYRQWNDPDRPYILGLMAATPDGVYPPNRALINDFAATLGTSVATVTIPAPSPVVVVPPPPVVVQPSAGLTEAQIRLIIAQEIAKLPAQPINGVVDKLVVRGKLCVVEPPYATDCDMDKTAQVQIRGRSHAAIALNGNVSNEWRQGDTPPEGSGQSWATIGMSPDLGVRICQNQSWDVTGYKEYIAPKYGKGCAGFDSQAQWSFAFLKPGDTDPKTQQMVLLDLPQYGVSWTTWRADRQACLVASSFKYGMDRPLCTTGSLGANPRGAAPSIKIPEHVGIYW